MFSHLTSIHRDDSRFRTRRDSLSSSADSVGSDISSTSFTFSVASVASTASTSTDHSDSFLDYPDTTSAIDDAHDSEDELTFHSDPPNALIDPQSLHPLGLNSNHLPSSADVVSRELKPLPHGPVNAATSDFLEPSKSSKAPAAALHHGTFVTGFRRPLSLPGQPALPCVPLLRHGALPLQAPPQISSHQPQKSAPNPRRSAADPSRVPPSLVRQEDRKRAYVEELIGWSTIVASTPHHSDLAVDITEQLVGFIWPMSRDVVRTKTPAGNSSINLRFFIREVLKRCRASHSTLQVAMYYCYLIWSVGKLPPLDGRRMFLSSLMLAYKYLQDRNYSTHAWSSISSLPTTEIKRIEMVFLKAVDYNLFIRPEDWQAWRERVDMSLFMTKQHSSCSWEPLMQSMQAHQQRAKDSAKMHGGLNGAIDTPSVVFEPLVVEVNPSRPTTAVRRPGRSESAGILTPPSSPLAPRDAVAAEDASRSPPSAPKPTPLSSPDSPMESETFRRALSTNNRAQPGCVARSDLIALPAPEDVGSITPAARRLSAVLPERTKAMAVNAKCGALAAQVRPTQEAQLSAETTPVPKDSAAPFVPQSFATFESHQSPYTFYEEHSDLIDEYEDQATRRLAGRSSKNRPVCHEHRKRSIARYLGNTIDVHHAVRTKVRCRG